MEPFRILTEQFNQRLKGMVTLAPDALAAANLLILTLIIARSASPIARRPLGPAQA